MADERTEAPTPKRREEVRKRGQTARSQGLTAATVLLAGLHAIKLLARGGQGGLSALLVDSIPAVGGPDKTAPPTGSSALAVPADILPPLLGMLAIAALAASEIQGGFLFAPGRLTPTWERLSPIAGTKKILSSQSLT